MDPVKRLLLVVLVSACGPGPSGRTPQQRPSTGLRPFGADLHVHSSIGSNDTDGISNPADYVPVARERGLSLVVLTDHSNSAGSMDCPTGDVEDCPNQGPEFPVSAAAQAASGEGLAFAVGTELSPVEALEATSVPTGYMGCLPRTLDAFADETRVFTDRPVGTVPGGAGVD